jgi:ketosteroid isomerase-like protein
MKEQMADRDVHVVEQIYNSMAAGDFARVYELIDPSCVITQDPRLPWGGRFEGHEGFAEFGITLRATITSTVTTDAIFQADGDVIQVGRTRGTTVSAGASFDVPEVHRWTIRDGRAVAAHFSIDTPAMLQALRQS